VAYKFRHLILGVLPPKILEPKNLVFNYTILRLDREYLQIGTRYNISSIGKRRYELRSLPYVPTIVGGPQTLGWALPCILVCSLN